MKYRIKTNKVMINMFTSTIQLVLLLISLGLVFAPALVSVNDNQNTFSGLEVIFGKVLTTDLFIGELHSTLFEFSILNLIPYFIIILGIITLILSIFSRNRNNNFIDIVLFILLALGGFLFLQVVSFTVPGTELSELVGFFGSELKLSNYYEIGIGTLVSAILLFIASLISMGKLIFLKY